MAPPAGTLRVGRYFLALLAILAVLYVIVFFPGQRHTPKLGLDLVGGTEVIFTAKTDTGRPPSSDSMEQAKEIIQQRVNGTGVTEATVVIQGSDQLVVSIPGSSDTDVRKLGAAAVLNFRGVVAPAVLVNCRSHASRTGTSPSTSPSTGSSPATTRQSPSSDVSGAAASATPLNTPTKSASSSAKSAAKSTPAVKSTPASGSGAASGSGSAPASTPAASPSSTTATTPACSSDPLAAVAKAAKFAVPTSDTAFGALTSTQQQLVSASLATYDCSSAQNEKDLPNKYFLACADGSQVGDATPGNEYAYLLGPVIVAGKQISTATAVAPNSSANQLSWTVSLNLKGSGQSSWASYTSAHNLGGGDASTGSGVTACSASATPCADYVAFTLDGAVISSPVNQETINGGATQISGGFTPASAQDLANKLKYGALPLSFRADEAQSVSATLGSSQLASGLLAGGIGLILVVIYSLIYYRALGLVTIASLLVSGALTYGSLVMLGTQIGFTLSLAGIAGFIVAIGITADSFVVFFERLKDEVHEGRSVRVAVPRAWVRARRTILSADTVSFLAAAILYYFAAGDVKGFAFTLGLSTILDLVVVFLFTHPMVSLLSRSRAFGSPRFTGLDALRGGPAVTDERQPREQPRGSAADRAAERRGTRRAPSSVAVLDDTDDDTELAPDAPSGRGVVPGDDGSDVDGGVEAANLQQVEPDPAESADTEPTAFTDPTEPRRRTAPAAGSAAERAAQRRARLRAQRDEDGEN